MFYEYNREYIYFKYKRGKYILYKTMKIPVVIYLSFGMQKI